MPQPSLSQAGFNIPVTNLAVAYSQSPQDGAGWSRKMAPIVSVDSYKATYKIFNKGDFFRNEMVRRENLTVAAEAGFAMSDGTTTLAKYSLAHPISDDDKRNWKLQSDMDKHVATFLQQKAFIAADALAVTNLLTAGVGWGTELVGAASAVGGTSVIGWHRTSSTPLIDLTDAIDSVRQKIGKMPNRLGLSPDVLKVLRRHADFTARLVGGATPSAPGVVSMANIEAILGLPAGSVFEMGTVYNSANKGQTASMAYVAAQVAWVGYVPDAPSLMVPSASYTFTFSDMDGLSEDGAVAIKTWRDEPRSADVYEATLYHDIKLVAGDCGFLYSSILS